MLLQPNYWSARIRDPDADKLNYISCDQIIGRPDSASRTPINSNILPLPPPRTFTEFA